MRYLDFVSLQKEKNLKIFTIDDIQFILALSNRSAKTLISRYFQKGLFISIKKGLYYSKDLIPTKYEIANKLYSPSYISLHTALSLYNLIPEVVYTITSITPKITKRFEIEQTEYSFRKIKKGAFTGYTKDKGFLIAEPEKALADYFYLVSLNKIPFNDRLNLKSVSKRRVLKYTSLFKSKSLDNWIKENYDRQRDNLEDIN